MYSSALLQKHIQIHYLNLSSQIYKINFKVHVTIDDDDDVTITALKLNTLQLM